MIEAEWWEYDSLDELADAVAGDIGFIIESAVDARGTVAECTVDRGTGSPAIDSALCNIAHDRLRFRPALNRSGQAVAGWAGYAQPAPR